MKSCFFFLALCVGIAGAKAQKQRLIFTEYSFVAPANAGQGYIRSAVNAYGRVYPDTSVVEYNPSLTDTFAYNQLLKKLPKAKADYVYYYSQWQNWPAGLVHYIRNHTAKEIGEFFNKYIVAYYFTRYDQCPYNASRKYFLNTGNTRYEQIIDSYLIEIPAAENSSLPDSMKPATDIYITLRWRPGMDEQDWAQLGITGEKQIKKASEKLEALVKAKDAPIDTTLYFKTIAPVKEVTTDLLLQHYRQYMAYLDNIYLGYRDIAAARKQKAIDELNQGIQGYKNLLIQAIDAYRDNCAWLMKAYNNKEYDKILMFSKWKIGFKFTGNSPAGPKGPHLYSNADHTLTFETKDGNLRMSSHVVTSGIGDELDTPDKKVGDVFQDFNIWGDFKFDAGNFTPLPGQNMASFTHYNKWPFDELPKYFLSKKVNGLLDADFTFIINTSGLYDYPVPQIILNGEKFNLKWTYGDDFSAGTDLLNAEIDNLKKKIAELEKQ